ncbi:MAG: DUF2726 domain-containing protein [Alphaproteobacteria bacterium]|nr:DUF2726 domain-containing protein [Alphaproteobacteria bacterium]
MHQMLASLSDAISRLIAAGSLRPTLALVGAVIVAMLLKTLSRQLKTRRGVQTTRLLKRPILTDNEREFFDRLCRALPDHHVFPQVSLDALLCVSGGQPYAEQTALRNSYSQKHPDFVVCQRGTMEVVAIVELDDKTHKAEKDQKRDAMLTGAGYRIKRFQSRAKPSEAAIKQALA